MSVTSARAPGRSVEVRAARRTSIRMSARAVVLLILVGAIALLGIAPMRGYLGARGQLRELNRQAAALERRNATLEGQIARLNDPAELARLARECLGMVDPGETAFVIVPMHGKPPASRC